ncbi:hypothetical protein ZIOFF_069041 [Zingiber officinale]|uniref:Uncharacterized protein n=1 Tax=Zingiber officinale TaxID=94328 RepID=A0A8J5CB84_ZINOF|nr:hypothetical protein ZIOFF_069041 [Zingiber officinale]
MDKYFGNAYRGDPGVPHADPDRFANIWIGSVAFSALTWINPYMWQLSNQFKLTAPYRVDASEVAGSIVITVCCDMDLCECSWHDKAMLFEHYHWKKALQKNEPYEFKWNQMSRAVRDSYYFNWPVYFP